MTKFSDDIIKSASLREVKIDQKADFNKICYSGYAHKMFSYYR